jgi:sugar phosphate isomerase/epimerase
MAGADPAEWIRKFEGRVEAIHLQDMAVINSVCHISEVMEGNMNWRAIMQAANETGVKYALIEQDDCYGKDPFECLRTSLHNLKNEYPEDLQ